VEAVVEFADVMAVVAATDHTCALRAGRVYCAGANTSGQLGIEAAGPVETAQLAAFVDAADWLVAGYGYTCVRLTDGRVGCFGLNDHGQLGSGDHTSRYELQDVNLPSSVSVISTRFGTVCVVLEDNTDVAEGTVYCWGANENNQCGTGTFEAEDDEPTPVMAILDVAARDVSVGRGHTCVVSDADELWCWGSNGSHELGLGPDAPGLTTQPSRVSDLLFAQAAAGQNHTCAISTDQQLYCWGDMLDADGHPGPMGHDDHAAHDVPARVGEDADWTHIATDTFHSCGLRGDGELWCWGRNAEGQLGVGSAEIVASRVNVNPDERFTSVVVGRFHTCALREDGVALCAGKNENGELASGDVERRATLTPIQ
jgi:alpha-tubulin suppressor-like RCC1 family protein